MKSAKELIEKLIDEGSPLSSSDKRRVIASLKSVGNKYGVKVASKDGSEYDDFQFTVGADINDSHKDYKKVLREINSVVSKFKGDVSTNMDLDPYSGFKNDFGIEVAFG